MSDRFNEMMLLKRRITPIGPVIAKAYTSRVVNQASTEEKPLMNIVQTEFPIQVLSPDIVVNKRADLQISLTQSLVDNIVSNDSVRISAPQSLLSNEIVGSLETSQPETLSDKEVEVPSPVIPDQQTHEKKATEDALLSESKTKPALMSNLFKPEKKEERNNDSINETKVVSRDESKVSPKLVTKLSIRVEINRRNIPKTQKSNTEWTEVPKKNKTSRYGKSSVTQRASIPVSK